MLDVTNGAYFMVDSDRLHSFEGQEELGEDVRTALQNNLGLAVGEDVLPIAHWQHEATGPLSVSLNAAGELVVLVSAEKFEDQPTLLSTLSALEQWLTPMGFRELSEMSGSPPRFVEGVRKLKPDGPLSLASMLRILLINPSIPIDQSACEAALPFCRLETLRIETFRTTEGAVAIRKVIEDATTATPEGPAHAAVDTADQAAVEEDIAVETETFKGEPIDAETIDDDAIDDDALDMFDETTDDDVTDLEEINDFDDDADEPEIDLTVEASDEAAPLLLRGGSYPTADLPLRFDLSKSPLKPVSHEMFTAGSHLALVVDLDKSPESSLETSSIFRWDGSERQLRLFKRHRLDEQGRRRTVHLFVEKAADANKVSYVGKVVHAHEDSLDPSQALWLELDAKAALAH